MLILTLVLMVLGTRIKTKEGPTFSLANTNALKGLLAVMVILHHIAPMCNPSGYLETILGDFGGIAVGGFFFLSAYGLIKSYSQNKDNYWKKIFLVKIPILYAIQVVINLIYFLILYSNTGMPAGKAIISILNFDLFFGYDRLNGYSWFITSIIVVYAVFGVALLLAKKFKTEKNQKLFIGIFISAIVYGLYWVVCIAPISNLYNRSIVCFIMATWLTLYEEHIINFFKKKSVWIISLTTLTILFLAYQFIWPQLIGGRREDVLCLLACGVMFLFAQKFTLEKSFSYSKLGIISLEFYLFQNLAINVCQFDYSNFQFFKALAIIGLTIVLSVMFHICVTYIKQFVKNIIEKQKEKQKEEIKE